MNDLFDLTPANDNEPPAGAPVSRLGDLWTIGPHRVLCGDSTKGADVMRAMGALRPALMATDPPYGIEYAPEWRGDPRVGVNSVNLAVGRVANDNRADWSAAWRLFRGGVAYVWCASMKLAIVERSLAVCGFEVRAHIIWRKAHPIISRGHYHWQHETCVYAVRKGETARWQGARDQTTVWEASPRAVDDGRTGHATQKPVTLMQRPILNHTRRGEAVFDPFLGSGATLIAAASAGRIACGLEIHPPHVDAIARRAARFVGAPALLDGDGRDFDTVARERAA